MSTSFEKKRSWKEIVSSWTHPKVITMLFLGFSAGIPILLIFSTLSVWLREAEVTRSSVTFFSWAALGYSFKFIWAPLVDKIPFPYLTGLLGRRRSWMLISQLSIIVAILLMGSTDPSSGITALTVMACSAVLLGFSSATQDIVIDAYRIECIDESYQALLASAYIAGYRVAMIVAGAGSLFIASFFGTTKDLYLYSAWQYTYYIMAATMIVGILTTLIIKEPASNTGKDVYTYDSKEYFNLFLGFLIACAAFVILFFVSGDSVSFFKEKIGEMLFGKKEPATSFLVEMIRFFLAVLAAGLSFRILVGMGYLNRALVAETYVEPVRDFFQRYGMQTALLLLLLIGFYRVSDIVLGVISNVFYTDMGFSKNVIAGITKFYGLWMTIIGGFIGGMLTLRYGVYAILFLGALLSAGTNLLFLLLAGHSGDITLLTVVIAVDNLSAGIAATAFVAFLSSLTSVSFTAIQYALFSSLMTLFPKLFGGYSGSIVDSFGYGPFFILTTVMGIPVLILVYIAMKVLGEKNT